MTTNSKPVPSDIQRKIDAAYDRGFNAGLGKRDELRRVSYNRGYADGIAVYLRAERI